MLVELSLINHFGNLRCWWIFRSISEVFWNWKAHISHSWWLFAIWVPIFVKSVRFTIDWLVNCVQIACVVDFRATFTPSWRPTWSPQMRLLSSYRFRLYPGFELFVGFLDPWKTIVTFCLSVVIQFAHFTLKLHQLRHDSTWLTHYIWGAEIATSLSKTLDLAAKNSTTSVLSAENTCILVKRSTCLICSFMSLSRSYGLSFCDQRSCYIRSVYISWNGRFVINFRNSSTC